jgi:hypothetical protein
VVEVWTAWRFPFFPSSGWPGTNLARRLRGSFENTLTFAHSLSPSHLQLQPQSLLSSPLTLSFPSLLSPPRWLLLLLHPRAPRSSMLSSRPLLLRTLQNSAASSSIRDSPLLVLCAAPLPMALSLPLMCKLFSLISILSGHSMANYKMAEPKEYISFPPPN